MLAVVVAEGTGDCCNKRHIAFVILCQEFGQQGSFTCCRCMVEVVWFWFLELMYCLQQNRELILVFYM